MTTREPVSQAFRSNRACSEFESAHDAKTEMGRGGGWVEDCCLKLFAQLFAYFTDSNLL